MKKIINIGSRKSKLAIAQTNIVINELKKHFNDYKFNIVELTTIGDKILNKPLVAFGGKGIFISEIENALINNKIDIAVHSAKDMPIDIPEELDIIGVVERDDPRDVIITLKTNDLQYKNNITIGTSSLRRQVQIPKFINKKVEFKDIRGNIDTRLNKLKLGEYDAIILASAGLKRLNINECNEYNFTYIEFESLIPAGGQGIIAIEGKKDNIAFDLIRKINDKDTEICLMTERKILQLLNLGCHEPIGVYSYIKGDDIFIHVMYRNEQFKISGSVSSNLYLAEKIAIDLIKSQGDIY